MAKISDLPTATVLTGAEEVPVVQSGSTRKTTLNQLARGDYRKVESLAERDAIPTGIRTYGLRVYVRTAARVFEWTPGAGAGGADDWVGLPTTAELVHRGSHTGTQPQDTINGLPAALDDLDARLASANGVATMARGAMGTDTIGRPTITDASTTATNAGTYIFAAPVSRSGIRHTLRVRKATGSSYTIYLARYTFDGTKFELVPGTGYVPVIIPGLGNSTIPISFYVARGEHVGFSFAGSGAIGISYASGQPSDSGGYYAHNVALPSGPFAPTSGGIQKNIQLQIGMDADYALAYDDALAVVQPTLDAHASSITANTGAIATNAAAIAANANAIVSTGNALTQITVKSFVSAGSARPYNASGAFAPGTGGLAFYEWAVGLSNGSNLVDGQVLAGIEITLQYLPAATRLAARLYSRPSNAAYIDGLPENPGDTAEWSAWQAVDVGALGFAAGNFGTYQILCPAGQAPLTTGKSFYLRIRSYDSGGNLIALGYGNGGAVAGAAGAKLARGFYRQGSPAAGWVAVTSTTASLAARALCNQYQVPGLPRDYLPRKDRGLIIYWGRAQRNFDNSGLNTFRRIFAVPANAKRVRRVIFAHATTTPLEITRAAVAPIATAANFAAAGVSWTPLRFGGNASEAGTIPAAAGSLRNAWLASNNNPVTLLDRTDTPGAAKLVCVAAYLGGGGTPVLLGTDTADDYSHWASRSDFPMVMRHSPGDCVTTPANFTSTTNRTNGTCIAGLEIETEAGELLTIASVGDSITNGAGGTAYGYGWPAKLSYALNRKWRGSCPVMLGWSGISMAGIRNLATDFYGFVVAHGLAVPNLLYAPNASPNSITPPITPAQMNGQRVLSDEIIQTALSAGSQVVSWTIIPTNPSVKDYNASDSIRRDYNAADRTEAGAQRGLIIADMDAIMAGVTDADGQVNILAGYTTDNIHPSDAGHDAMAGVAERAARLALPAAGYATGGVAV